MGLWFTIGVSFRTWLGICSADHLKGGSSCTEGGAVRHGGGQGKAQGQVTWQVKDVGLPQVRSYPSPPAHLLDKLWSGIFSSDFVVFFIKLTNYYVLESGVPGWREYNPYV